MKNLRERFQGRDNTQEVEERRQLSYLSKLRRSCTTQADRLGFMVDGLRLEICLLAPFVRRGSCGVEMVQLA